LEDPGLADPNSPLPPKIRSLDFREDDDAKDEKREKGAWDVEKQAGAGVR
jgi:hypothetical protein